MSTGAGGQNPFARNSDEVAFWHAVVEDQDNAIIRYLPDLTVTWCNSAFARLYSRTADSMIGRNMREWSSAEDVAAEREVVEKALHDGQLRGIESGRVKADGGWRWWSWNVRVVRSPLTNRTELQAVGHDITALKQREAELKAAMDRLGAQSEGMAQLLEELKAAKTEAEQANLAKSRFLANMSHELRTPLNAIIGFADIMQLSLLGPIGSTAYEEYVANIWKSGKHLLDIITNILDISRIEVGQRRLQMTDVDPVTLAKEVQAMMPPKDGLIVAVMVRGAEACGPFKADRLAVRQALVNLLSNALKFTPIEGRVWMAFRRLPGAVEIEVGDTGPGLTAEQIASILSPFGYSEDDSLTTRKGRGAGLGIPIAKSLAEAHGGSLRLSGAPGHGTLAILSFPQPPSA